LVQLRAAVRAGLTVPRTLVSSDPQAIRRFRGELGAKGLVMKALTFDKRQPLLTLEVEDRHLDADHAIRMCPTMFQELVPGDCHLRVLMAGNDCHAIAVTSQHLDWRPHLDVDARPVDIDPCTQERLRSMLTALGLRMGIFDLKLVAGQTVFLEVNPQGQFLFMDGLADVDTATAFASFLHSEAVKDLHRRVARSSHAPLDPRTRV
jgi:glutathione synthase/RimK-type ligase-like ATP-grasp enzyme